MSVLDKLLEMGRVLTGLVAYISATTLLWGTWDHTISSQGLAAHFAAKYAELGRGDVQGFG